MNYLSSFLVGAGVILFFWLVFVKLGGWKKIQGGLEKIRGLFGYWK
jgi:hypothetical protein